MSNKIGKLNINDVKEDIYVKLGDMFRITEEVDNGQCFIYLGNKQCYEIPFSKKSQNELSSWNYYKRDLEEFIRAGKLEKLPKGSTFTITQD